MILSQWTNHEIHTHTYSCRIMLELSLSLSISLFFSLLLSVYLVISLPSGLMDIVDVRSIYVPLCHVDRRNGISASIARRNPRETSV